MTREAIAEKLTMRPAAPADYAAVIAIQRAAYELKEVPLYGPNLAPTLETEGTLADETAAGKRIFVGETGGKIVASLRLQVRENGEVYFGRLSVDPALQGRGIGQAMVLGLEKIFPDAPSFALDCGVKSAENNHIYSKLGYAATDETFQVVNGPLVRVMRKVRK